MNRKKPFPIFREPTELTPDTPVMGIPGRIWDEALTGRFVENLQKGNEILRMRQAHIDADSGNALDEGFDAEIFALAITVFGTGDAAKIWLTKPALSFEREVPSELCKNPSGREAVRAYLLKIEPGEFR